MKFKYFQGLEFRRKKFKYFQELSTMSGNPVHSDLTIISIHSAKPAMLQSICLGLRQVTLSE